MTLTNAYEEKESIPKELVEDTREIAVQVNGKVRGTITISNDESRDSVKEKLLACGNVKKHSIF